MSEPRDRGNSGEFNDRFLKVVGVIDYTEMYRNLHHSVADGLLAVQAEGRTLIKLWREDAPGPLVRVYDRIGRRREVRCPYTIEIASLSCDPRPDTDGFASIEYGPDVEQLTATQARKLVRAAEAGKSLFDFGPFIP